MAVLMFVILPVCMFLLSCSTVSHIPADELLYTGTRPAVVSDDNGSVAPLYREALSEAKVAFVSPPNNALFGSSRFRTPFPVGLWAYNAFVDDTVGLRRWLFRIFAAQPVYVSAVNPSFRAEVAQNTLYNYGYFDSRVSYRVDTLAGGRKAKVAYAIDLGKPWYYGTVEYRSFIPPMDSLIRETWHERLLREGGQFSYASLNGERNRLCTLFRDRGYYFYRPEMISLLADTLAHSGRVEVRILPQSALPRYVLKPWHVGHTFLSVRRPSSILSDTLFTTDMAYIHAGHRVPVRPALLTSRLAYRRGDLYSPLSQDATLRELNRLGVFSAVSVDYVPRDSVEGTDTLDVHIQAMLELPYELSLEANFTAKSNDQAGPGVVLSLSRKNLLRMAETMRLRLKGSYEWQTNRALRREGSVVNSFELGADIEMSVPMLLLPEALRYTRPTDTWRTSTSARFYADWLNRGGYFRMLSFGGNLIYTLAPSPMLSHSFTPFRLTFNTLERTTERFDSVMTANPAIGLSFRDQFVPAVSYNLTYDNALRGSRHPSKLNLSLSSAGALTSLAYALAGQPLSHPSKQLMGTPFAQFVKGSTEACRYYHFGEHHVLATRVIAGAVYAYGNSSVAPFSEQFYVGGANDLRAFPLRGIGPGSYHSKGRYAYIDHTGDLKLEANLEWRFPLVGQLGGALFADAGNVWLLRADDARPGAQFNWSTLGRDIALGTGFGLRYNLRVLLVRVDVGIPIHIPYDTGKRGYYNVPHFGKALCFHLAVGYPF